MSQYPKLSKLNTTVPLPQIDEETAKEVQSLLKLAGLYTGEIDGIVGTRTLQAFARFKSDRHLNQPEMLGASSVQQLLELASSPKLKLGTDLASRLIKAVEIRGYKIFTGSELNIIYVEGMNPNGTLNADRMNEWNDLRLVIAVRDGEPQILELWAATTEPGWKYTAAPLNPGGAFRIAFGQYQSWRVGIHRDHEALVQCADLKGFRDKNKDGKRTGDATVVGSGFGVNQHWGYDMAQVNGASAGCLVGQSKEGHRAFMALIKTDPRYKSDRSYRFWTTILNGEEV